jgi:hypothetical protein
LSGGITEGRGADAQEVRRRRSQSREQRVEICPEFEAPTGPAHHQQAVKRRVHVLVVGIEPISPGEKGAGQEPVGGIDVAMGVQQHVGSRDDSGKGSSNLALSVGGFLQHVRRAGQVARHVSAEVGGLG